MNRFLRGLLLISFAVMCFCASAAFAGEARYEIQFPNPPGLQTLKCDLHLHTVFSDGLVWPTVRVAEAWRQGLDVIAISDHIEYQPHKEDVPTKHGRWYELAKDAAETCGLLLLNAAEITRDTPPGHFNAIFLKDVQPLDTKEFLDAIQRANEQQAYVFWNHQGWQGEEKGQWLEVHEKMYQNKWFHGMEVCNGDEYYPTAHKWCVEKHLPMLGNTDMHEPDLRMRNTAQDHRTMTLVFAKEKTAPAIKEALMAGQTAVWYKDQLIGHKEWLEPLFRECLRIAPPHRRTDKFVWVLMRNVSDADLRMTKTAGPGPTQLDIPARGAMLVRLDAPKGSTSLELGYVVSNWLIAPGSGLPVVLRVDTPAGG